MKYFWGKRTEDLMTCDTSTIIHRSHSNKYLLEFMNTYFK